MDVLNESCENDVSKAIHHEKHIAAFIPRFLVPISSSRHLLSLILQTPRDKPGNSYNGRARALLCEAKT